MSQKHVLVEHLSNVNSIIKQSLQLTQRIKFTCFDVSQNYVVFGATSGGLYICQSNPYTFKKLVPTKEGAVVDISISPTEKFIALASNRGFVVIVEDAFTGDNLQYQSYSEHEGSLITAMKWYGNELFCGDQQGRVSVISLTKAIFQMPCSTLMKLDSSIVQIDAYSKYLLISTQTRTYFCDTDKEQYKQIGKKLRDGYFGACFLPISNTNEQPIANSSSSKRFRGVFNKSKENEQITQTNEIFKIFTARPGSRIWEVGTDANVICTHQFKNTLNSAQSELLHLKDDPNAYLNSSNFSSDGLTTDSPIFGKLMCLSSKYLLTYNTNGIYIIDPELKALIHWTHYFIIKDVKIHANFLYILTDNIKVKTIALYDLEEIILKTLLSKQYYVCAGLCLKYSQEILQLVDKSQKIHYISILRDKLKETKDDLLVQIEPVLSAIRDFSPGYKLESGIVVVNNLHTDAILHSKESSQKTKETKEEEEVKIMREQFEYNKIHPNIETTKYSKLLNNKNFEQIVNLYKNFIESNNNKELIDWCYKQCLKQIEKFNLPSSIDCPEISFVLDSFLEINKTKELKCKCGYPLPSAQNHKPYFYEIGCELLRKVWDNQSLAGRMLEEIPYLRKYVLENLQENREISVILPLLIQYSECDLLKQFYKKFTYDVWDDAVQFLIKLKRGLCLNCDNKFPETCDTIPWSVFGGLMVQSLGGTSTAQLLFRYSDSIPCDELGADFFLICVFSTTTDFVYEGLNEKSVDFVNKIKSDSSTDFEFNNLMAQFLNGKHMSNGSLNMPKGSLHSVESINAKCNFCDLPIVIPILSDSVKLNCSHLYHRICMQYLKNVCIKCKVNE